MNANKIRNIVIIVIIVVLVVVLLFKGEISKVIKNYNTVKSSIVTEIPKVKAKTFSELAMLSSWQDMTPPQNSTSTWKARDAQTVITFNNEMYLFGGLNGNASVEPNGTVKYWESEYFNDIWKTADGVNWTKISDKAPWGKSRSMSAVVFNNSLYVFCGWNADTYKYNNSVWKSDDGINWVTVKPVNSKFPEREGQVALVYNDRIWIFGGVNFATRETYNDVWTSSDGIEWQEVSKTSPWTARYDHAMSIFQDKMYLTGGLHIGTHKTESEVWVTTDGINWEKRVPQWPSRHGHISLTYNDSLWIIGGWHNDPENDSGINDTWFTEDGFTWKKISEDGPWLGREDHMGDVFLNKMWLTGGMDSNEHWNGDVYSLEVK